jgi:hypothetical protein
LSDGVHILLHFNILWIFFWSSSRHTVDIYFISFNELCYPRTNSFRYGLHGGLTGPTATVAKITSAESSGLNLISVFLLIYIQKDATLHGLFYLETALHISGGTSTYHQERNQLHLQHLNLSPHYCYLPLSWKSWNTQTSSNSSTLAADSSNGVTNYRCCRYSWLRSWWWVDIPAEICRAVSR